MFGFSLTLPHQKKKLAIVLLVHVLVAIQTKASQVFGHDQKFGMVYIGNKSRHTLKRMIAMGTAATLAYIHIIGTALSPGSGSVYSVQFNLKRWIILGAGPC